MKKKVRKRAKRGRGRGKLEKEKKGEKKKNCWHRKEVNEKRQREREIIIRKT